MTHSDRRPGTAAAAIALWLALLPALTLAETGAQPPPGVAPDQAWVTPFEAFAPGGQHPLFKGETASERKGGVTRDVQTFRAADGKTVHVVESVYDETRQRPLFYESRDLVNGRVTQVRLELKGFEFSIREANGDIAKSGVQEETEGAYFWPNLVQVIDAHWDQVRGGKDMDISLFFAALNTNVSVRVMPDGEAEVNGNPGEQFKVEARNVLLKAFMTPIRLVFSTEGSHRLLVFEGRSVVSDSNRKNLDLRIVFGARRAG